jgi:hypothetical protein
VGGELLLHGQNANLLFVLSFPHEADSAVNFCEKRMVATHSNIRSWRKYRSTLTDKDVARLDRLTTESFHAQPL